MTLTTNYSNDSNLTLDADIANLLKSINWLAGHLFVSYCADPLIFSCSYTYHEDEVQGETNSVQFEKYSPNVASERCIIIFPMIKEDTQKRPYHGIIQV